MERPDRYRQILGVRFFVGTELEAIDQISQMGGLVVAPAAPALKNLVHDEQYCEALLGADFAIADSALMVLLWNLIQRDRIPKLSGLRYLRALINGHDFHDHGSNFWVMPTANAARLSVSWLTGKGVQVADDYVYVAPMYGETVADLKLLRLLDSLRPKHVVLCIGGGQQEKLGLFLKRRLNYRPAIHCIGAAIGFLSGDQVPIPVWADRLGLGWFMRCLSDPKRYGPRYWDARHLAPLMLRYRDRLPVATSIPVS